VASTRDFDNDLQKPPLRVAGHLHCHDIGQYHHPSRRSSGERLASMFREVTGRCGLGRFSSVGRFGRGVSPALCRRLSRSWVVGVMLWIQLRAAMFR
jgi:hypothetical protein